jgi:hypothetical protein
LPVSRSIIRCRKRAGPVYSLAIVPYSTTITSRPSPLPPCSIKWGGEGISLPPEVRRGQLLQMRAELAYEPNLAFTLKCSMLCAECLQAVADSSQAKELVCIKLPEWLCNKIQLTHNQSARSIVWGRPPMKICSTSVGCTDAWPFATWRSRCTYATSKRVEWGRRS